MLSAGVIKRAPRASLVILSHGVFVGDTVRPSFLTEGDKDFCQVKSPVRIVLDTGEGDWFVLSVKTLRPIREVVATDLLLTAPPRLNGEAVVGASFPGEEPEYFHFMPGVRVGLQAYVPFSCVIVLRISPQLGAIARHTPTNPSIGLFTRKAQALRDAPPSH